MRKMSGVMMLGAALVLSACGSLEEATAPVEQGLSAAKQAAVCEDCETGGGGGGGGGSGGSATPHIEFFEGNNATQDSLGRVYLPPYGEFRSYDLTAAGTNIGIPNDEARSMVLRNLPAGTRIVLCDCHDTASCWIADRVSFTVRFETLVSQTVGSFEEPLSTGDDGNLYMYYSQHPWRDDRIMDGKVSVIQVFAPGVTAQVANAVGCDY